MVNICVYYEIIEAFLYAWSFPNTETNAQNIE